MLFLHGFDAVEELEEGLLEDFGVSVNTLVFDNDGGAWGRTRSVVLSHLGSSSPNPEYSSSDS